jgi:F420H(2)-dependent quinone reductase
MDRGLLFRRVASAVNKVALPLVRSGPGRRLFGDSMAIVTYTGRKSGREVTLPVNYRREKSNDQIVIGVMAPDAKTWWRNFSGDGAPMRLRIGADERAGHAHAVRAADGSVSVRVSLS